MYPSDDWTRRPMRRRASSYAATSSKRLHPVDVILASLRIGLSTLYGLFPQHDRRSGIFYGTGQLESQSARACPTLRGHVIYPSKQLLASLMKPKQASKGCKKIHRPDANLSSRG